MRRSQILFAVVAIVSALLAFMLLRGFLNQQPQPSTPIVEVNPQADTVPVLVASRELAMGERINGLSIEWRDWPRANVTDVMITKEARPDAIEQFEGARARAPILQGEPLADRKILAAKDGNLMSALVREGLRGFAIRVSERTAGGGFILPNDRVDIIGTFKAIQGKGSSDEREIVFSGTIITNVRVLAINQSLAPDGNNASLPDLETAVVEVDMQQAEVLARSDSQGELSLALRSLGEAASEGEDRPQFAALTRSSDVSEIFKNGARFMVNCNPRCDPILQAGNSPFPLIVSDDGVTQPPVNR